MVKTSRSGSHKAGSNDTPADESAQVQPLSQPSGSASGQKKGKQKGKSQRSKIGGTAITGAKSTQPKELTTSTPANQQAEYYNRDMRRRMEHMGTGPYSERVALTPRERRKKRQEHLQERQQRIKQLVDAKGPSRDVKLGRRNTYFLIGMTALLVIIIVVFLILRHPF